MGLQGGTPGRADYWKAGSWNVTCSMCGRKRKFDEMERNWQGFMRCPEHNEPRQPQDFVTSATDIMTVPYALPLTQVFTSLSPSLPATVTPTSVVMVNSGLSTDLDTELGAQLQLENGSVLSTESIIFLSPPASVLMPAWLEPEAPPWVGIGTDVEPSPDPQYVWSFPQGVGFPTNNGANITINSPTLSSTTFQTVNPTVPPAIAQVVVTLPNGATATLLVTVTVQSVAMGNMTLPWLWFTLDL